MLGPTWCFYLLLWVYLFLCCTCDGLIMAASMAAAWACRKAVLAVPRCFAISGTTAAASGGYRFVMSRTSCCGTFRSRRQNISSMIRTMMPAAAAWWPSAENSSSPLKCPSLDTCVILYYHDKQGGVDWERLLRKPMQIVISSV